MQKYTDRRSFPLARVCKQEQNTGGGRDRQKADRNRQERTRVSDRKNTQTSSSVTFGDAHKPTAVFLNIWLSLQFAELNWMPTFIVASRLWHHHRNTIRRVRAETLQARLIYDPKTQKQKVTHSRLRRLKVTRAKRFSCSASVSPPHELIHITRTNVRVFPTCLIVSDRVWRKVSRHQEAWNSVCMKPSI